MIDELGRARVIMTACEMLTPREKFIIIKRFGLDGYEPRTLSALGEEFGVTRERIRQLTEVALHKLVFILSEKKVCLTEASKKH